MPAGQSFPVDINLPFIQLFVFISQVPIKSFGCLGHCAIFTTRFSSGKLEKIKFISLIRYIYRSKIN